VPASLTLQTAAMYDRTDQLHSSIGPATSLLVSSTCLAATERLGTNALAPLFDATGRLTEHGGQIVATLE
jgi:hypothetical protein